MMAPRGYPPGGGRYPEDNRFPPGGPQPGWADPRWTPDGYGSPRYEGDMGPAASVTDAAAQHAPVPKPVGPPPALPAGPSASASSAGSPIVVGPAASVPGAGSPIVVGPAASVPGAGSPIIVGPSAAAEAPVAEPVANRQPAAKPEPRPDVASPSGSIPPPAPILPTNPPELPDPEPVNAGLGQPVPVTPVPVAPEPMVPKPVVLKPAAMGTVIVDGGEDVNPDDDTAPIPVITPDMPKPASVVAPPAPAPAAPVADSSVNRIRAPFEPLDRKPASPVEPKPEPDLLEDTKLDQIKDLYLTAEAIGEDALSQHFQQVSDRQRQLIREYFDQVANRGGPDEETS
jgi:hypothetical protein